MGGNWDQFDATIAYSSVDDGTVKIENFGTHVKSPLYTQVIFNQDFIKSDSDTFVAKVGMKALDGKFGFAYNYSDYNFGHGGEYTEMDLTYKTKVFNGSTTLFAGYIYRDNDSNSEEADADWDDNILRFWARYNF